MSEHTLNVFRKEQQDMNNRARYMVLFIGGLIHLFLNVYAQVFGTPWLKVEVPVISAITIAIMILSGRYFDRHAHTI